jgi:hypothetical protein
MDTEVQPQLSFNPTAGNLALSATSAWDSDLTYTAHYDVMSGAATISDIDVNVAGTATDVAGNPMIEMNFQDVFDIDIASSIAYAISSNEFVAYPNPLTAGSDLRLAMPSTLSTARVLVLDCQGKMIADLNYVAGNPAMLIRTDNWSQGMYLVRILSDESTASLKVTISE